MKQVLVIAGFAFLFSGLHAQYLQEQSRKFILDFYQKEYTATTPFIYSKGVNSYETDEIIDALFQNDTLKTLNWVNNKYRVVDSLYLTPAEKQFIKSGLEKMTDTTLWNGLEIPGAISISGDSIRAIFTENARGWAYFNKNYGKALYRFSVPLFFRNNTLCAFYQEGSCGRLCGSGEFAIYRLKNGKWVKYFVILEWVS